MVKEKNDQEIRTLHEKQRKMYCNVTKYQFCMAGNAGPSRIRDFKQQKSGSTE